MRFFLSYNAFNFTSFHVVKNFNAYNELGEENYHNYQVLSSTFTHIHIYKQLLLQIFTYINMYVRMYACMYFRLHSVSYLAKMLHNDPVSSFRPGSTQWWSMSYWIFHYNSARFHYVCKFMQFEAKFHSRHYQTWD